MLNGMIGYKIGITNRSVVKRYLLRDMKYILDYTEHFFWLGTDAEVIEKHIKNRFSVNRCLSDNYPLSSGFTECFDIDFDLNIYVNSLIN